MLLDSIDLKLLNLLQEDAKRTNKQLSLLLNLSTTATFERVKKLEKLGVIRKYAAIVDEKKLGKSLMVLTHVRLERHSQDNIAEFEQAITQLKEVHECFHVSGDSDYILKMTFSGMDAYRDFIVNELSTIPSIGSTHSTFVINEVKNEIGIAL